MKRTHLPLNGLRVLDAAARHLSFTKAADELAVTPAAVGQQIRALEDMLGVVMFRRTPKGLELTDEASAGLDALRSGFLQFEEAVRAMQSGQSSHKLTIAAPRDFTQKWLNERLSDVAIWLGDGPGQHEGRMLGDTVFVKVAAPGHQGENKIDWPGCPISEGEDSLMRVADGGLAIEAAANGFGYAWVPRMLVQRDLAAGRVEIIGKDSVSSRGYWLMAPLPQWRQQKVKALVEALAGA